MCWCAFSGLTFRVYLFRLWNSCHDNDNCLRYWQRGSGTLESFPESSQWRLDSFSWLEKRKARGEIYDPWNYGWCRLRSKPTKQIKGECLVIKKTQGAEGKTLIVKFLLTPPLHRMYLTSQAASAKGGKKSKWKIFVFVFFFFLFTDYFIPIFENSSFKSDTYILHWTSSLQKDKSWTLHNKRRANFKMSFITIHFGGRMWLTFSKLFFQF